MRAETRKQSITLFDLYWENACQVTQIFTTLCVSVHDCKNATRVDFGVANKFQLLGELTNTESTSDDNLYYFVVITC